MAVPLPWRKKKEKQMNDYPHLIAGHPHHHMCLIGIAVIGTAGHHQSSIGMLRMSSIGMLALGSWGMHGTRALGRTGTSKAPTAGTQAGGQGQGQEARAGSKQHSTRAKGDSGSREGRESGRGSRHSSRRSRQHLQHARSPPHPLRDFLAQGPFSRTPTACQRGTSWTRCTVQRWAGTAAALGGERIRRGSPCSGTPEVIVARPV